MNSLPNKKRKPSVSVQGITPEQANRRLRFSSQTTMSKSWRNARKQSFHPVPPTVRTPIISGPAGDEAAGYMRLQFLCQRRFFRSFIFFTGVIFAWSKPRRNRKNQRWAENWPGVSPPQDLIAYRSGWLKASENFA
jgi:hypothetical protein